MAKRVYFLVHGGTVQGVGFRYFTQKRAMEYGLSGWVRNTANNKVEGEAQGEDESIKKFLKDIDQGPRYAHVVKLDVEDRELLEDQEDATFQIRK